MHRVTPISGQFSNCTYCIHLHRNAEKYNHYIIVQALPTFIIICLFPFFFLSSEFYQHRKFKGKWMHKNDNHIEFDNWVKQKLAPFQLFFLRFVFSTQHQMRKSWTKKNNSRTNQQWITTHRNRVHNKFGKFKLLYTVWRVRLQCDPLAPVDRFAGAHCYRQVLNSFIFISFYSSIFSCTHRHNRQPFRRELRNT